MQETCTGVCQRDVAVTGMDVPPNMEGVSKGQRTMVQIKENDLIESVAGALQYISYYHPVDYITNLARAI